MLLSQLVLFISILWLTIPDLQCTTPCAALRTQHQDQTLQLKISEEDVKGEDRGTYVTNAGGCTLITKGFFLHVAIE